jgi:glycosyltransferase involved in cell wall biosynthesis
MKQSGFMVLPSHTEGFPNVILEAMSHGLPVVATSVGGIPEILENGGGIVIPPKDTEALKSAMELLIADEALRETMGEIGRMRVKAMFETEFVVSQLVAVWSSR